MFHGRRTGIKHSDPMKKSPKQSRYLLAQTDSRTRIEGQEYEWIWSQILLQPVIEESVRVEFKG